MIVVYKALNILLNLIRFLILIRILLSFINLRLDNIIGDFIFIMTEPILSTARNLISKLNINTGIFDFSPLVAILFLNVLASIARKVFLF